MLLLTIYYNSVLHSASSVTILWFSKGYNWFINCMRAKRVSQNHVVWQHSMSLMPTPLWVDCSGNNENNEKKITKLIFDSYLTWIEKWNAFFHVPKQSYYNIGVQDSIIRLWVDIMRFSCGRLRLCAPLTPLETESFSFCAKV